MAALPRVFGFTPGLFSELSFACHAAPDDASPETDHALRPSPVADLVVREVRGDWVRFDDPAQRRAHATAAAAATTAAHHPAKSPSSGLRSSPTPAPGALLRSHSAPPPPHASPSSSSKRDAAAAAKSEANDDDDDNTDVSEPPATPPAASAAAAAAAAAASPGLAYASPAVGVLRQHWTRWRSASGVTILEPTVYRFAPKMAAMGAALNVRESPSGTGTIVGKCESDTVFVPVAVAGSWVRVVRPEKLAGIHEGTTDVWVMRKQPGAGGMVLLVPEGAPDDMDQIFVGIALGAAKAAAQAAADAEAAEQQGEAASSSSAAAAAAMVAGGWGQAEDGTPLKVDCGATAEAGGDGDVDGAGGYAGGRLSTSRSSSRSSRSSSSRRSSRAVSPAVGVGAGATGGGGGGGAVASAVPARVASPWDERPLSPMKDLTAFETKLSPEKLETVAAGSPLVAAAPAAKEDEEAKAETEAGTVVLEALDLRGAHDSEEEEDEDHAGSSSAPSSLSASGGGGGSSDSAGSHHFGRRGGDEKGEKDEKDDDDDDSDTTSGAAPSSGAAAAPALTAGTCALPPALSLPSRSPTLIRITHTPSLRVVPVSRLTLCLSPTFRVLSLISLLSAASASRLSSSPLCC